VQGDGGLLFGLAITVFVYVQYTAIRENGLFGWLDHMAGTPRSAIEWGLVPLAFPIHLIGELAKPVSLSCRLFGNIFGEDMLLVGNFAQYRQLAESTSLPLIAGERVAGRYQFGQMLESRAFKYIMFDVCWCGGLSEARKIAAMAEAAQLPVAPHTAGGPLLFYASTHLTTALTNVWIQESCQRFYESDWPKMLDNPLVPSEGGIVAPSAPGFGMEIKPEIWQHPAAVVQTTTL
jgi:L-alanine-DL-glutamate epimerase-like enolase superfamily enzyme